MTASPTLLLSLTDVARLARVQRPVVSMWRSRSRASASPFPVAVERRGNQELFAADAVARWLTATGRGNNPTAVQDAAGFAASCLPSSAELTAMLTLRSLADEPLAGWEPADILDAADDLDPDDRFLYSELEAAGDRLAGLGAAVDQIVEASFTPAAAFERLMQDRFRSGSTGFARTALTPELAELAATAARTMAANTGASTYVEVTPGGSDLLAALVNSLDETAEAVLGTDTDTGLNENDRELDDAAVRISRRRLHVLTAHHDGLRVNQHPDQFAPRILMAQFPGPAAPGMTDTEILSGVDELALSLGGSDAALVIGPAAVLVDALPRRLEAQRSQTLRLGRLRAAVRLPAGLALTRVRQPMAAWVLGADQPQVPIADRRTMIADLSTANLGTAERQDLVSDLAASLGSLQDIRAHAFRFARLTPTSSLLANGGSLTERARHPAPVVGTVGQQAADLLVRTENALRTVQTAPAVQTALGIDVDAGTGTPAAWITLGELVDAGAVTVLPGTRLTGEEVRASPEGLSVWQQDSVRDGGHSPRARIALVDFASAHPSARLTEPGDVLFLTGREPAACVDEEAAAVVRFPVRALRASPGSGLVPKVLAQDLTVASGPWRSWRVRRFGPGTAPDMSAVLGRLGKARNDLTAQLARLDDLTTLLIAGVTSGAVQATPLTEGTD